MFFTHATDPEYPPVFQALALPPVNALIRLEPRYDLFGCHAIQRGGAAHGKRPGQVERRVVRSVPVPADAEEAGIPEHGLGHDGFLRARLFPARKGLRGKWRLLDLEPVLPERRQLQDVPVPAAATTVAVVAVVGVVAVRRQRWGWCLVTRALLCCCWSSSCREAAATATLRALRAAIARVTVDDLDYARGDVRRVRPPRDGQERRGRLHICR